MNTSINHMAVIPKVYIDNNDKIHYSDRNQFTLLSSSSQQLTAGLEDIAALPGQSTWIINKIRFGCNLYTDIDGSFNTMQYGSVLLGIIPYDDGGVYDNLDDYQDVRGWPLLDTWKAWTIPKLVDGGLAPEPTLYPIARASISGTYRPKSPLALNRMQKIIFNVDNVDSVDVYGSMWMFISARRGE